MAAELTIQEPTLFDNLELMEQIDRLFEDSESYDIEFKSARNGFPESFWETYSAFANTQGGTIILGVREKKDHFIPDGLSTEQIAKYKKDFWNQVNNRQCISTNLLKNDDVQEVEYKGTNLLLFNVPRADRKQMPVYRTTNPFGNTYKRNHEGDYKCTESEIRRMIADSDDAHPQDARILEGFSMDDIDGESLKQYRQLFATSHPNHPWLLLDDRQLLEKLGGYRTDRQTGQKGFTLAGLLMFGKVAGIQDPACAPAYFPDYRECQSEDPAVRWTDRVYPDGTWEANLFQFYHKVYTKLAAFLPKPFKLEKGIRREDSPTHTALREALVNTLVHCDYTEDANIVVSYTKDRFTFSNPGTLLISQAQYYRGGESVCRNKSLQKMFMQIGRAEKAGSGVDKIIAGWNEARLAHPYVSETSRPDKVVLELPLVSLLSQETLDELKRLFGEALDTLNNNELLTLATCCAEGEISNERLRLMLDLHRSDITRLLQLLCKGGYLISHGSGRGTRYKINQHFFANVTGNVASNVASNVANLPSGKRTRLSPNELQNMILRVCTDYLSLEEIAEQVGKGLRYLKNSIIPEMVARGLLEREYPNVPKHPSQRYRAKR